jgi:Family of unknown function (DUF6627)
MKRQLTGLLLALTLGLPQSPSYAGLIPTETGAPNDRERVMALAERPEVAQQLEKMGIPQDEAKARIAAMSQAEVASLAGKLDALPAGGALGNQEFLIILIVIVLILVLLL